MRLSIARVLFTFGCLVALWATPARAERPEALCGVRGVNACFDNGCTATGGICVYDAGPHIRRCLCLAV